MGRAYYSDAELSSWDQRESMRPAPYKYAMARPARGLNVADPLMAKVPSKELACHGKTARDLPRDPEPEWVDWELVERGQALWKAQIGRSFTGLGLSLLSGFSISRFADILYLNGYAKNGETAIQRYRATGFYILDFYRSSLRDPESKARRGIANVRAMHEWARRHSGDIFDQSKGEGVPLSQLDMAEVQLGFAGICIDILEDELGAGKFSDEDATAMVHCWRLIGYHLGIMDEYNICNSLEDMRACVDDFMAFTPRRLETLRPSTAELRRTAMEGFGMESGLGTHFWHGLFQVVFETRRCDIAHLSPPASTTYPGMGAVARFFLLFYRSDTIAAAVSRVLVADRDIFERDPQAAKRSLGLRRTMARIYDDYIWRFTGMVYLFRHVLVGLALLRVFRRLRSSAARAGLLM